MVFEQDICPDACVAIDCAVVGILSNNAYVIRNRTDASDCFMVDPSCHGNYLLECVGEVTPKAIICTHYHFDHVGAAAEIREATGAFVYAHEADADHIEGVLPVPPGHRRTEPCTVDVRLHHGDELQLAGVTWRVIHTPGHSPGGMCLFAEAPGKRPVLIAGDTLFQGTVGRVDFVDGDGVALIRSLTILLDLPAETFVLTGHGEMTTIAELEESVFSRYVGSRKGER